MSFSDEQFFKAMRDTPPLPDGLLHRVESTVRRRDAVRRAAAGVAAATLLMLAGWWYQDWQRASAQPDSAAVDSIDNELQRIGAFANAVHLEEELLSYVVLHDFH